MHQKKNIKIISKNSYFLNKPAPGSPWVLRVAIEHWHKDFDFIRYAHNSCFISFVQDGNISIKNKNEALEAGPGDIIYLTDEDAHRELTVPSKQGAHVIIIILRGTNAFNLAHKYLGNKTTVLKASDPGAIEPLFYSIFKTAEKAYPPSSNIAANLLLPTLQTIKQENKKSKEKNNPSLLLFNKCREYINHNYLEIKSVSDVADKFTITHSKLCRMFKEYEDTTPHSFLLKRKLTRAVYELHHQNNTVSEVAFSLGFADPYSFSKSFKRVMGYSPSQAKNNTEII